MDMTFSTQSNLAIISEFRICSYVIMENVTEIDLGLALGINNHGLVDLSTNRDAGAGANANSNLRIIDTVAGPRPLSELVWSTQNGLTIKWASCSNNNNNNNKDVVGQTQTQMEDKCHLISPRSITPAPFLGSSLSHTGTFSVKFDITYIFNL